MTTRHDPDRLVQAFFEEGPAELSPRLLAGIREDIHQTRQRTLRRPWRNITMPRPILLFAVIGAVLLAAGAMLLAGGGRPSVAPPSPSPAASGAVLVSPSVASTPTPPPTPSPTPAVSPYPLADGEAWIVLGGTTATMVRPDGTGKHLLLGGLGVSINDPAWSPDGRQLAFDGNGDVGSHIWIADADGTGAHMVTSADGCPEATCTEGINPAWSPDGRSIAYVAPTHVANDFTENSLMVLDVASGQSRPVYTTADVLLARPTWSPDGRSIAFEIDREDSGRIASTVIAVIAADGADRTPKEITPPALLAGYPSWHPTDDLIVVRTNRIDNDTHTMMDPTAPSNLYTLRSDGSALQQITDNPVGGSIVRAPSWTPDGRILFTLLPSGDAEEQLLVIDAAGTSQASATGDVVTSGQGRWRPNP
jgi:hypothetical protein